MIDRTKSGGEAAFLGSFVPRSLNQVDDRRVPKIIILDHQSGAALSDWCAGKTNG